MIASLDLLLNSHDYFALHAAFPEIKFQLQSKRDHLYDYEKSWIIVEGDNEGIDTLIKVFCKPRIKEAQYDN